MADLILDLPLGDDDDDDDDQNDDEQVFLIDDDEEEEEVAAAEEEEDRPSFLYALLARLRPFLAPPPNGGVPPHPSIRLRSRSPPSDADDLARFRDLQRTYTANPDAVPPLTRTLRTFYLPNPISGDTSLHVLCVLRPPPGVVRDMIDLWPDMRILLGGLRIHLGEEALRRALDDDDTNDDDTANVNYTGDDHDAVARALVYSHEFVTRRNRAGATPLHAALACGAGEGVVDLIMNEGRAELRSVNTDWPDDSDNNGSGDSDDDNGEGSADRETAPPPSMASLPMRGGTYPLHVACRYCDDIGRSTTAAADNDAPRPDGGEACRVIRRLLREGEEGVALKRSGFEGRNALSLLWMDEYKERKMDTRQQEQDGGAPAAGGDDNVGAQDDDDAPPEVEVDAMLAPLHEPQLPQAQAAGDGDGDGNGDAPARAAAGDVGAAASDNDEQLPTQTISAMLRLVRLVAESPSLRDLVPQPRRGSQHYYAEDDGSDGGNGEHDNQDHHGDATDGEEDPEPPNDAEVDGDLSSTPARSRLAGLVRWAFGKKFRTLWECSSEMVRVRQQAEATRRRRAAELRIRNRAGKPRRGKRWRQSVLQESAAHAEALESTLASWRRSSAGASTTASPRSQPPLCALQSLQQQPQLQGAARIIGRARERAIQRRDRRATQPPLLHGMASYPQCPPDLLHLAYLHGHRPAVVRRDAVGRLPIHLASSNREPFLPPRAFRPRCSGDDHHDDAKRGHAGSGNDNYAPPDETVVGVLLREHPVGAFARDGDGRLPVHRAAASGCGGGWSETGLDDLVLAHPDGVTMRDPVTGLFPFMLAGALREEEDGEDKDGGMDDNDDDDDNEEDRRRREREELHRVHASYELLRAAPEILSFEGLIAAAAAATATNPGLDVKVPPKSERAAASAATGEAGTKRRRGETVWGWFVGRRRRQRVPDDDDIASVREAKRQRRSL